MVASIYPVMTGKAFRFLARFMADIMDSPDLIRNVALAGHLHHGKVSPLYPLGIY